MKKGILLPPPEISSQFLFENVGCVNWKHTKSMIETLSGIHSMQRHTKSMMQPVELAPWAR